MIDITTIEALEARKRETLKEMLTKVYETMERKVKKAVKSTGKFLKKNKGKIARSALNLASAFGSEGTKQKADNIRLAHEIVKGSGPVAPGAALRKLVS